MDPYAEDAFYRVSVKALIFDAAGRVLVFQNSEGQWEMPGGGWEHHETLEECISRELAEEMRVETAEVGPVQFMYRNQHEKGYYKLCIVVTVTLVSADFVPADDDLVAAKFVSREEFLELPFQKNEENIRKHASKIWAES